ncbi:DUF2970 domain-containing protein [Methylogaea oryzae]|uniref:DUF2970 domain-containing protein n=1 Tax=Methylogaea oryzae TaxID=1295382 RepID=A0A8D4VNB9_9GAMM|nr:DUF2970 domain-containing protein [Methylogaea oryzae]BBL71060.1 hypothetical protein MoryE10_16660 [Methylogaea oryzae]
MSDKQTKPNLMQVIASTLSAAIGIQSSANRERDFTAGSAKTFIVTGVIGTVLFILAIIFVVRLVLSKAGAA